MSRSVLRPLPGPLFLPMPRSKEKAEPGSAGTRPATSRKRQTGRRDACAPRLHFMALHCFHPRERVEKISSAAKLHGLNRTGQQTIVSKSPCVHHYNAKEEATDRSPVDEPDEMI